MSVNDANFKAGDSSIPYIELCAASQIEKNWRREIKADGELGLALNANETGSETRKILTPIASLVNNSKVPLMIIFQKRCDLSVFLINMLGLVNSYSYIEQSNTLDSPSKMILW